jgi:hypothetical protein
MAKGRNRFGLGRFRSSSSCFECIPESCRQKVPETALTVRIPLPPPPSLRNRPSTGSDLGVRRREHQRVGFLLRHLQRTICEFARSTRSAEIARLALGATIRDVRAATEAAYYQLILDSALAEVDGENVANLERVVRVAQTAYSTSKVSQTDFISAQFDLAAARQLQRQYRIAIANDETILNQQLNRPPGSPLAVDQTLRFEPLKVALDALVERAYAIRAEVLEAALTERNINTAPSLAKMEYLPDFTVAYQFDNYLPTRHRSRLFIL